MFYTPLIIQLQELRCYPVLECSTAKSVLTQRVLIYLLGLLREWRCMELLYARSIAKVC